MSDCVHRTKDVQTLLAEKKNLDSTVGAFIIFNNRKSQQRCLDEYAGSSTWFGRLSQKRQLRFRGITPISVTEAPEPADIRWYEHAKTQIVPAVVVVIAALSGNSFA